MLSVITSLLRSTSENLSLRFMPWLLTTISAFSLIHSCLLVLKTPFLFHRRVNCDFSSLHSVASWSGDMEAWYHAQALWRIVSNASKSATVSVPARDGEEDKLEAGQVKADKAAGIMWLMVEPSQRVHFRGIKDDAVKMWGVLEGVHMQKQPGTW